MIEGKLTCKADQKVCNVTDVRGIARGIMIHLIRFSRLVLNNVEQKVDC